MEVSTKRELNRNGDKRGLHPHSLANLQPGKGRPKNEASITATQRKMLPLSCPYAPDKTWCEYLAERGMAMAAENATYYKELMDRLEGKVVQPIGGDGESPPIPIKIIVSSENARKQTEAILAGKGTD